MLQAGFSILNLFRRSGNHQRRGLKQALGFCALILAMVVQPALASSAQEDLGKKPKKKLGDDSISTETPVRQGSEYLQLFATACEQPEWHKISDWAQKVRLDELQIPSSPLSFTSRTVEAKKLGVKIEISSGKFQVKVGKESYSGSMCEVIARIVSPKRVAHSILSQLLPLAQAEEPLPREVNVLAAVADGIVVGCFPESSRQVHGRTVSAGLYSVLFGAVSVGASVLGAEHCLLGAAGKARDNYLSSTRHNTLIREFNSFFAADDWTVIRCDRGITLVNKSEDTLVARPPDQISIFSRTRSERKLRSRQLVSNLMQLRSEGCEKGDLYNTDERPGPQGEEGRAVTRINGRLAEMRSRRQSRLSQWAESYNQSRSARSTRGSSATSGN